MPWNLTSIAATYDGSDGDQTKALYAALMDRGPQGVVAMNLFRASKCSARAKVYRGGNASGSFKHQAYERKAWSIDNLATTLVKHGENIGIRWGWGIDPKQQFHCDVLYADLPTGQISFHTASRTVGPTYKGQWDGARGASASRIIGYCASVFHTENPDDL